MSRRRGWWGLLLLPLLAGCASTRVVRLDTGTGAPLEYAPPTWDESVEVDEDAFRKALTQLVLEVPLSLRPAQAARVVRAVAVGPTLDTTWQLTLRKDYGRWCKAHEGPSDCLSLLEEGLGLSAMDRLTASLAFAFEPMREGMREAVQDTFSPQFFSAVVLTGIATWVALLAVPEPVVTKAAAVLTAVLVVYLGVGPFLNLVKACFRLKASTDKATTFAELEDAGARFGHVLGEQGARVAILVFTALLGRGSAGAAEGLATRLPMLPGYSRAAALGAAQVGLTLENVGQVSAVAVIDGRLVISLPSMAVAMVAMGPGGGNDIPGDPDGEVHHICTDKNTESNASGGPWTPLFERIFDKAGMSLKNDPANQVRIRGHQGPHPQAYHQAVFDRVQAMTSRCRSAVQCREALTRALRSIAAELATPGSELRNLVTRNSGQ